MRRNKKGYALPTAIVVTTVLLIIAAAFVSVTYNNINVTSRDLSSRQAYINAKSALIYATAYYKQNPTQIPMNDGDVEYLSMKAEDGTTTEGIEKTSLAVAEEHNCYVEVLSKGNGKLTLTAYAKYGSAIGSKNSVRKLSTDIAIDLPSNLDDGSDTEVDLPAIVPENFNPDWVVLPGLDGDDANEYLSVYVKRHPDANFTPYVYTWAYGTMSGYERELDAQKGTVDSNPTDGRYTFRGSYSTELNPSGFWRHADRNEGQEGLDRDAITQIQNSNDRFNGYWGLNIPSSRFLLKTYGIEDALLSFYNKYAAGSSYTSRYAASDKIIGKVNMILAKDAGGSQSNEMFGIPTTRGSIFVDMLTAELHYDNDATLKENSNDSYLSVYTENTVLYAKVEGVNEKWNSTPTIIADGDGDLSEYQSSSMVYCGNGWYKFSITSFIADVTVNGNANGSNIVMNGTTDRSESTTWYMYQKLNGQVEVTNVKPSDNSLFVHVKVNTNKDVELITTENTNELVTIKYIYEDSTVEEKVYLDSSVTLKGSTTFTRPGYTLSGWRVLNTDTVLPIDGQKVLISASYCTGAEGSRVMTLTPEWTEADKITINFYDSDGTHLKTEKIDSGAQIPFPTIPEQDGKYLLSWTTNKDGSGKSYDPTMVYTSTKNLTLYAQWGEYLTVTFDANGGDSAPDAITGLKVGDTIQVPSAPTRSEYTFRYWTNDLSGAGNTYNPGQEIKVSASMTLYASWKSDKSKEVRFEAPSIWRKNGVTVTVTTPSGSETVDMSVVNNTNIFTADISDEATKVRFSLKGTPIQSVAAEYKDGIVYRVSGYDSSKTALLDVSKSYTAPYYVDGYVLYTYNNTSGFADEKFGIEAWNSSNIDSSKNFNMQYISNTNNSVAFIPKSLNYDSFSLTSQNAVYFIDYAGWSEDTKKVYAYMWSNSAPSTQNAAFPGVEMTRIGGTNSKVFKIVVDNNKYDSVIFSKGDNNDYNKTSDLKLQKGGIYGNWKSIKGTESGYIYYSGNYKNAHLWYGTPANDTIWPGTPMSDTSLTYGGKVIKNVKIADQLKVIFDNETNDQTGEIWIPTTGLLYTNGDLGWSTYYIGNTQRLANVYDISSHTVTSEVYYDTKVIEMRAVTDLYQISESCVSGAEANIVTVNAAAAPTEAAYSDNSAKYVKLDTTLAEGTPLADGKVSYKMIKEETRIYYKNKKANDRSYDTYGNALEGDFGKNGKRRGQSVEVKDTWYVYNISTLGIKEFQVKVGSETTAAIPVTVTNADLYIEISGSVIYVRSTSGAPNAYMWNESNGTQNAPYPGVKMSPAGEPNVYSISTGNYTKVIFSGSVPKTDDLTIKAGQIYDINTKSWSSYPGATGLGVKAYTSNPDMFTQSTTRVYYRSSGAAPKLQYKGIMDASFTEVTMLRASDGRYSDLYYYDVPNDKIYLKFNGGQQVELPANGDTKVLYTSGSTYQNYESPDTIWKNALSKLEGAYLKYGIEKFNTGSGNYNTPKAYSPDVDGGGVQRMVRISSFNTLYDNYKNRSLTDLEKVNLAEKINALCDALSEFNSMVMTSRMNIPAYGLVNTNELAINDEQMAKLDVAIKAVIDGGTYTYIDGTSVTVNGSYANINVSDLDNALSEVKSRINVIKNSVTVEQDTDTNPEHYVAILIETTCEGYPVTDIKCNYTLGGAEGVTNFNIGKTVVSAAGKTYYYIWIKGEISNVNLEYKYNNTSFNGKVKDIMEVGSQWIYDASKDDWRRNAAIRTYKIDTKGAIPETLSYKFEEEEDIFYIELANDCTITFIDEFTGKQRTETIYAGTYYVYRDIWETEDDGSILVNSSRFYYNIREQMYDVSNNSTVKMAEVVDWMDGEGGTVKPITSVHEDIIKRTAGITVNFFVNANTENMTNLLGSIYTANTINFKWYNNSDAAINMNFTDRLTLNASTVSVSTGAELIKGSDSGQFLVGNGQDGIVTIKILADIQVTVNGETFTITKGKYIVPVGDNADLVGNGVSIVDNRINLLSSKEGWEYLTDNYKESLDYVISGGL